MSVRGLDTGKKIELIEDNYLRTTISEGESLAVNNKKRVFRETAKHFTRINEREDVNIPGMRELYYPISVDDDKELPLDSFRIMARDAAGKQMILDGLLEILLLVSEGKIYDVELNPLNFVAEDKPDIGRVYVKAFYRQDRGLREITDEWLENAKKLIGYFLVSDTGINETNFNSLKPVDIYHRMNGDVAEQYLKILKSPSIDRIAREWFTESVYNQIKGFPPIVSDYRKPKDVTELSEVVLGGFTPPTNETFQEEEEVEDYEEDDFEEEEYIEPVNKERVGKKEGIVKWVIVAILVAGGIGLGGMFGMKVLNGGNKAETVEVPVNYYNGMIKASIQKYQDAGEDFDLLTPEEMELLGENEKLTIYISYLKGGEFDKALQIDPDGAETVIMYLDKRDQKYKVADMESDHPVIQFEKAVLEQNYSTVVDLKNSVRDTDERQLNVIEALVMLGDVEDAIEYIKEKDLKGMESKMREYYNAYAKEESPTKKEIQEVDKLLKDLP